MSYDDVCAIAGKGYKARKGAGKKGSNGSGPWHRGKGADEWTSSRRSDGGKKGSKKGPRTADPLGTVTVSKEVLDPMGTKAKARTRVKPDTATIAESKGMSEYTVHTSGPTASTKKMTKARRGRVSLKEKRLNNSRVLETLDDQGEWCWPRRNRVPRWRERMDPTKTSISLPWRIRQTERSKNGKGFKGPGGENNKNCGQQVMSVRTMLRKSTWQVADVRRPLVSASHDINRRKKEKSMLRKECVRA